MEQHDTTAQAEPVSLAGLAAGYDTLKQLPGNQPLDLSDPQCVWYIEAGTVNLFLVERLDGEDQVAPQHLFSADAGRILPGIAPLRNAQKQDSCLSVVAKGLPGTVVRRLRVSSLARLHPAELASHVDAWLLDFSAMLSRDVMPLPKPDAIVEPGTRKAAKGVLSARSGITWVSAQPLASCMFLGLVDPADTDQDHGAASRPLPLTSATWLNLQTGASDQVQVVGRTSEALAADDTLLNALAHFHALALSLEQLNRRLATVDVVNLERERVMQRRKDEDTARRHLFNLYGTREEDGIGGPELIAALRIIGRHEGITFNWHVEPGRPDLAPPLQHVLDTSGVRGRMVRLDPESRWWHSDSGAMLAFRADDKRPVALVPGVLRSYWLVDPARQHPKRITAEVARRLCDHGWCFYPPLPAASAGLADMLRMVNTGRLWANLVQLLTIGLLEGLVLLAPVVVLGWLATQLIAGVQTTLLYPAIGMLMALALLGTLLHLGRGMVLMRIGGRVLSLWEAGLLDRILRLPTSILDRYMAGDLALSTMTSLQALREALHGVIANGVLSILCLLPVLFFVFAYDYSLGLATAAFGLLSVAVTVWIGWRQLKPRRKQMWTTYRIAGRLVHLIGGIAKLRVAGAEGSAYAMWARDYRELKTAELALGDREAHSAAFAAALPLLAGAVLFLVTTLPDREPPPPGHFLVVYGALMLFVAATARLGASFKEIAAIAPALDRIQPLLSASPARNRSTGQLATVLGGDLVFDHVSFRYDPNSPLVLDDVSIHVRRGEFVAIAGASGSGKSTLFRLALGIDQPTVGAVNYDGRNLKDLNLSEVRRQIGTVPQNVQLFQEDIWDNIVGDKGDMTEAEAWSSARQAGVAQNIASMPMGMRTCVGISDNLVSGGEAQRIMIARSLLQTPRIMLLDEATNWLDNKAQAEVMENLAALAMTRIVIAHRLSTLRQADRIFVLQAGKVIQTGRFAELSTTEGVFQDLIRRQMA